MGLMSKLKRTKSKPIADVPNKGLDAIYAQLRVLKMRIAEFDNSIAAIRRDVNRIDRKQLREAEGPLNIEKAGLKSSVEWWL